MPPMSKNYIFVLILVYLVVLLVSFVNLLSHNFKTESKNKELQNKILSTQLQIKDQELQYLKKQIHPHFLFNTLNTIYGFALKGSKDTPEIILKLSNLLDYILYQVSKPKVSLNEEILHLKEYIDLERIRFQDTLKISFESDIADSDKLIPPMLLIPFVENAFKHGVSLNKKSFIEIKLHIEETEIYFEVINAIHKKRIEKEHSGLGIKNLKKRLNHLYQNQHELTFENDEKVFIAKLRIEL